MKKIREILNFIDKNELYPEIKTVDGTNTEVVVNGKKVLNFCSLNYLGLANNPKVIEAAIEAIKKYGAGSSGSRFLSGNLEIHEKLEKRIADFKKEEAGLIFQTGYTANIGIISAIMNPPKVSPISFLERRGIILSDELNHASIIEGCRLAKAEKIIYKHRDMNDLEQKLKKHKNRRKLIITDGVFSMDADIAPLPEIVELAKKYNALTMIDEAHSTGVLGNTGRGTTEYFHIEGQIDIVMGTFSKAIGALGGYVVGSNEMIRYLRISAKPNMFSVAMPPCLAGAIIAALDEIENNNELRKKLWENVNYLKINLQKLGFKILGKGTQIIPVLIGEEKKAIKASKLLFEKGVFSPCVRWPAVPKKRSIIRFTVMATHTKEQIDKLLQVCEEIGHSLNII
ncbi:8-amino-7-oxononanoate synthase [Candidatus Pacearchaeota archaeon]|nr:MAG: 8-amino-7-oxononanoate synthase [Candidatus Pacearchaeota archaeon]